MRWSRRSEGADCAKKYAEGVTDYSPRLPCGVERRKATLETVPIPTRTHEDALGPIGSSGRGLLFFLLTLFPTFTNVAKGSELDLSFASDRYAYVPQVGLLYA